MATLYLLQKVSTKPDQAHGTPDAGSDAGMDAGNTDAGLAVDGGHYVCGIAVGGTGADNGTDVAFTPSGDILLTGYFENSVTFGPTPLTSLAGRDVFVAKYAAGCTNVWAKAFGGATGHDFSASVSADSSGGAYVAGYFLGTLAPPGVPALASAGQTDIFVASLDASGTVRWARRLGGAGYDTPASVEPDADGGLFVAGDFEEIIDFGGGQLRADGGHDIFAVRLSAASGGHAWSRAVGGPMYEAGIHSTCSADGSATVTGSFSSSAIDWGDGTLTNLGNSAPYVAHLGPSGATRWSRSISGQGSVSGVVHAANGDVITVGTFQGTLTSAVGSCTADGGTNAVVARYSPTGSLRWLSCHGSAGTTAAIGVVVAPDDSVVVVGYFSGTVDFGGGPLASAGARGIFALRLSSSGQHLWSRRFGGAGDDHGVAVAVSPSGSRLAITGKFEGPVDFGGGPIANAGPAGTGDLYLLLFDL